MLRSEFEKLSGLKINGKVYARIEDDYMNSEHSRENWWKKFGTKGVIRCYDEELKQQNEKLSNLARTAIDSYKRCHTNGNEMRDNKGNIINYEMWVKFMAVYDSACDALGIDNYAEDARQQLWQYVIV